jgi:hypothetical protein
MPRGTAVERKFYEPPVCIQLPENDPRAFSVYVQNLKAWQEQVEPVFVDAPLPPENVPLEEIYEQTMLNIGVELGSEEEKWLRLAFIVAQNAYAIGKHPKRFSGEDYMVHAARVAYQISLTNRDPAKIISAWFHDAPEDTNISVQDLKEVYGTEVSTSVDYVTKVSLDNTNGTNTGVDAQEIAKRETEEKILDAAVNFIEGLQLKLADIENNMRTIQNDTKPERVRLKASRALRIARIAYKVGAIYEANTIGGIALSILHKTEVEGLHKLRDKIVDRRMIETLEEKARQILCSNENDTESDISYYSVYTPSDYEVLEKDPSTHQIKVEDLLPRIKIVANDTKEAINVYMKIAKLYGFTTEEQNSNPLQLIQNGYPMRKSIHFEHIGKNRSFEIEISTPEIDIKPYHLLLDESRLTPGEKPLISDSERHSAELTLSVLRKTHQEIQLTQKVGTGLLIEDAQEFYTKGITSTFSPQGTEVFVPSGSTALDQLLYSDPEKAAKTIGVTIIRGSSELTLKPDAIIQEGDTIIPITHPDAIPTSRMYDKVTTNHALRTISALKEGCDEINNECETDRQRGVDIIYWLFEQQRGKTLDSHMVDAVSKKIEKRYGDLYGFLIKLGQLPIPALTKERHELWLQRASGNAVITDAIKLVNKLSKLRNESTTIIYEAGDRTGTLEFIGEVLRRNEVSAYKIEGRPDRNGNLLKRDSIVELVIEPGTDPNIVAKVQNELKNSTLEGVRRIRVVVT